MSNIDIQSLLKLQSLLSPILDAIPSLTELDAARADVERTIAIKREEVAMLEAKAQEREALLRERVDNANAAVKEAQDLLAATKQDLVNAKKAHVEDLKAATDAEISERDQKIEALDQQIENLTQELNALSGIYATAKAEHDAKISVLTVEVAEVESRKAAAETALAAIRASIG